MLECRIVAVCDICKIQTPVETINVSRNNPMRNPRLPDFWGKIGMFRERVKNYREVSKEFICCNNCFNTLYHQLTGVKP